MPEIAPEIADLNKASLTERIRGDIADLLNVSTEEVEPNSTLEKYGIDFISVMILADAIRRKWGVMIPIEKLLKEYTVRDISAKGLILEHFA